MLFVVYRLDRDDGAQEIRAKTRPLHLEYMKKYSGMVKAGGPILADDGITAIGGLMIIDAESRKFVEDMVANDPFELAHLSKTILINPWRWQTNRPKELGELV
jgi:uncharacterized protein